MDPLVSIIVPVYNTERYLNKCIESLVKQTYQKIEIILVNDGSTDNSALICEESAKKDKRIIIIHKDNEGLSSARNAGISLCSGDYLCFVDSDDWLEFNAIEETLNKALITSSDIVFYGYFKEYEINYKKVELFDNDILFTGDLKRNLHRRMVGLLREELSLTTKTDSYCSAWGKLYRKSLISDYKIDFISEREVGSEDVIFNIEMFYKAKNVYYLNKCFYHYRQTNENALTKTHGATLFPRFLNLFTYIENFINANCLDNDYKIALGNRISLSIINNALSITSKRNKQNIYEKITSLSSILNHKVYRDAINKLEFKYLPNHWKIFFFFCKHKYATAIFLFTLIIRKLR